MESSTAVRPPPAMPAAVQAAFAARREGTPLAGQRRVGFDDSMASMPTSWELKAEVTKVHPWRPAVSAYDSPLPSAACPAPAQPALVTTAVAEHRRGFRPPATTPAAVTATSLTSWEREADLLRHMNLAAKASHGLPGSLAAPSVAQSAAGSSDSLGSLRRMVSELDGIFMAA